MNPAHARGIRATFQRDGSTRFSDVPASVAPALKRKTVLENLILGDWGPTMRGIAWVLGYSVAIPAAALIVIAQWLVFTWRRPLAGVLALVPVRRSMTYPKLQEEPLARVAQSFGLTADELLRPIEFKTAPRIWRMTDLNLAVSSPNLTTSDLNKAGASISETELGPMSSRMDFGMARPTLPVAPQPPVLAPAPRRQRRGGKRPQSPA